MANQNKTNTTTGKKRNRRDPRVVASETACRGARQAASLAGQAIAEGQAAPVEVLQAMSALQGAVMVWINSPHGAEGVN